MPCFVRKPGCWRVRRRDATVTFNSPFLTASFQAVSPANLNAAALGTIPYATGTSTGFSLYAPAQLAASKAYSWNVVVDGH